MAGGIILAVASIMAALTKDISWFFIIGIPALIIATANNDKK
jgi:hypothetical protein